MNIRVGAGFDIHKLESDRPLLLGGVRIPFEKGLVGHSDGDVLFHAMTDALLGAAGLGNIGQYFPDTDPAYDNADSGLILHEAVCMVRGHGFEIANLDSTIIAEEPRLMPYLGQMQANTASATGTVPGCVQVKAKTMEGLGPIGRGEAIAAHAVVLIYKP